MNYIQYMKPGGTTQHSDATYVHVPTARAVQHPLLTDPQYLAWAEKQEYPTVEKYLKFLEETNSYGGDLNDADLPASAHKHSSQYLEQFSKEQAELQAKTNAVMSTVGMLGGFGIAGALAPMGTAALGASLGAGDYFDVTNVGSPDWNPGWKRTIKAYNDLKSGEVLDPTVFAGAAARDALDIVSMVSPAVVKYTQNKAVLDANARAYAEQQAAKTADNHIRIKVGDVEINDPNLAYRQVGESVAREFPTTGRQVPTLAESGYGMDRALKPTGIVLGKAPFQNPMYAQGHLWYGIPPEGSTMTGLLTTNQPLQHANKSARLVQRRPIITSEDGLVTTVYDPSKGGIVGTRRIPLQGQLNSFNTTAYIYDPKYGYRIVNTQQPKTSLAFFERQPAKISKAEKAGVPKGMERTLVNNEEEILNNAKSFAQKYGYEIPETIDAVKDMYKQHNSWFRTVQVDPLYDNSKYGLAFADPKLQTLPKTESAKILASRGYPAAYRYPGDYEPGIYLDDFVFASPSMATNAGYQGNPGTYTVMLQRPFSFRNPLDWHNVADYRPISKYIYEPLQVGQTQIGNVGPKYELKLATKHLIPVKIAQPTDKGTLLGEYLGNIEYKSGGSIHIKKKNIGSFTRYCKGKVTEECIRKGKNSSNPTTRKRANFAANARKWKHKEGGKINYLNLMS